VLERALEQLQPVLGPPLVLGLPLVLAPPPELLALLLRLQSALQLERGWCFEQQKNRQ
jgi:hypothetical protein